jgi:peptidyl-prolyl cis-trans isomerase SurA
MKKFLAVPILVAVFAVTAIAADQVVEKIIARINNDVITRSEFNRSKEQLIQEIRQNGADPARAAEGEKNVLRDLIDRQLLLQKGKDLGITGETEVVKELDRMRKEMKLETMEELEKVAQQQGVSFEDYKQNLRESIVTQQVISREVGSHIQITPDEIKKFYDEHLKEMEQPETVRLSEILISPLPPQPPPAEGKTAPPPPEPTPEQLAAAEQKAGQAAAELKGGAKFEDVAKKYSSGPTAQDGGNIGDFKRGTLAKSLEDLTFGMKAGQVSDPVRTKQGFVILKVVAHQQAGVPPLKDVQDQIQQQLYLEKLQPELRKYLTKLREDAYIDIQDPAYVDSGASPNQTKPIVTNTAVAEAKTKLKRKKHFIVF